MYDVITIGSATKDIFLVSKHFQIIQSEQFATGYGECVAFGSKIEIEKAIMTTGGGGTNAAATFAQLGFKTAVITRIGDDSSGRDVLEDLKLAGVKTTLVQKIKDGQTGLGVQLTAKDGERSVLVNRGVSSSFSPKDIPWPKLKSKWIYMTSLAGNTALAARIAKHAKANNIKIAFNPGSKELKKGLRGMKSIMANLTLLNLNLEEAQLLAGSKTKEVDALCKKIGREGLTLIITDGPRGAYAHQNGETWFVRPSPTKGISRTGAGDAFGSGLVASLAKGNDIPHSLRVGVENAESIIQSYGAKIGILKKWPTKSRLTRYKVRKLS
ncbi:carbohydrate kinase family protein [Candidatus Uhrbacteria bacterium]|jgi:sugar/nucleoside kinase (ribokinase family)|nr:carbohydrate kinase family protein [Candidatus Uhrbacteria bacterium]